MSNILDIQTLAISGHVCISIQNTKDRHLNLIAKQHWSTK